MAILVGLLSTMIRAEVEVDSFTYRSNQGLRKRQEWQVAFGLLRIVIKAKVEASTSSAQKIAGASSMDDCVRWLLLLLQWKMAVVYGMRFFLCSG